jgi:hypothetical protein
MHQWLDESSRDHHYSASISTFLRKYLAGLDQPWGATAWETIKCRPEAGMCKMDSLNQHFLQQFSFITVVRLFSSARGKNADERKTTTNCRTDCQDRPGSESVIRDN